MFERDVSVANANRPVRETDEADVVSTFLEGRQSQAPYQRTEGRAVLGDLTVG